jgi:hypothetical protein
LITFRDSSKSNILSLSTIIFKKAEEIKEVVYLQISIGLLQLVAGMILQGIAIIL